MPRIRRQSPSCPWDQEARGISCEARLTFIYAITQADDEGLLRAEPREILASLYHTTRTSTPALLAGWIDELRAGGFVRERQTLDGACVLELCNWKKHQKIDHPGASRIGPLAKVSRGFREEGASASPPDLGPRTLDLVPGTKELLHGGAPRRAESNSPNGEAPDIGSLMTLVRQHLYVPDGKPPADWDEARDGSILKALIKRRRPEDVAVAIEGLAVLRDRPGAFADAVDWLRPGMKVTCKALYNTKSGVCSTFDLACQAYWRHVNTEDRR
jgi:hypothetical protein